jgi:hypothetical protein
MKKLLPILILFLMTGTSSFSQLNNVTTVKTEQGKIIRCFTSEKVAEARQDPAVVARRAKVEARVEKYELRNSMAQNAKSQPPIYTIPVVVHIIYRTGTQNLSDARVAEQIQVLNEDYRRTNSDAGNVPAAFAGVVGDSEIEFCLAGKDPSGATTTGITRTQTSVTDIGGGSAYAYTAQGGKDIWDPNLYLNIWVCELGGGLLGFTYTPGNAPNGRDGVVIGYQYFGKTGASAPYNGGRTTTHEVGHWLNLEHVWGPGGGGCSSDDFVGDTPIQNTSNGGCPSHPSASCSNGGDMFMNYMDYVNDNCMNSFTVGQATRMRTAITAARPSLITSQACVIASDDAGVQQVNYPAGTICSSTFTPEVTIRNNGSSTLNSVVINYDIDGGTLSTQPWSGTLASGQTATVTLSQQTITGGGHTFNAYTTLPNGNTDGDNSNDASSSAFAVSAGGLALPFVQGFEIPIFPLPNWTITNSDNDVTWARNTAVAKTGAGCMYMDNWDYPANGEADYITLPSLNMSNSASVTMTFELAYALYSASGFSDTLRVWVSDDCGLTWTNVYEKYDNNLSTVGSTVATEFVPVSSEWRMETIDLSAYGSSSDVSIRFEHVNDYENNLYIDDVNISNVLLDVNQVIVSKGSLKVYPNPTTGLLNIDLKMPSEEDVEIMVFNTLGQLVSQVNEFNVLEGSYKLNMSTMAKGIYHIQVVVGGGETLSQKVILR